MQKTPCSICKGEGTVEKDGKLYECDCAFVERRAKSIPTVVRTTQVLEGHINESSVNMIGRHVHLVGHLGDMHAIIKVIAIKYPRLFIKVTSDNEIKDVHVGSMSRTAKGQDFNGSEVYNTMRDLVDPPHLLFIKLNELKTKNKAAANALLEALCYRIDQNKPTWVLTNVMDQFGRASPAFSESVDSVIRSFQRIVIPPILPIYTESGGLDLTPDPTQEVSKVESKKSKTVDEPQESKPKPRPKSRLEEEEDSMAPGLGNYGSGNSTKKRSFKKVGS